MGEESLSQSWKSISWARATVPFLWARDEVSFYEQSWNSFLVQAGARRLESQALWSDGWGYESHWGTLWSSSLQWLVAYRRCPMQEGWGHFFSFNPHPRTCLWIFREKRRGVKEREGERETLMWGKTSIGCLPCVPQPGIKPTALWCSGRYSHQLSHLAKAVCFLLINNQLR